MSVDTTGRGVGGAIVTPARRRRRIPRALAWAVVVPFAAWAVARVAGLERGSLATQLMTGTPYVAAGSLVPVLLAALARGRAAAVVALVTAAALGLSVLPRAVGSAEGGSGTPLRVLTLNMLFGGADPATVMDLVRRLRPDVLSTQELTPEMVGKLDAAGLRELLPHRLLAADEGARGSGLYARYPLTPLENLFRPIGHNMPAAAITLPGVKPVELVDVHPYAPLGEDVREWEAALEALPPAVPDRVRVLAGDFNASLDHAALRRLLSRGYADSADRVGQGLRPTWPANRRLPPLITIDHVMVDQRVKVAGVSVHTVPGTDHRAVFADLRLPGP
ncbi:MULTISPECIES: endonuclease/exonuclease/phosphatase family protein [Streptosporangium]|uniref:Endonuclease/exonuclease/phosphatase (EEP) superfamily protein YafD n=1 Tax=Streptosporangium brasiliense TaxID=47480 RepID=A0ABT9R9Z2_9ACTN|nr:endonuclease/exonuclease/phosphatase family protein [Streptosporangium brasiliense]MDP9865235.1 endonuclease/exonuclease/phosphatase (EEP) superfamily protein YafD [Streptosporangium brasiliense]